MSTHNICFLWRNKKSILFLSPMCNRTLQPECSLGAFWIAREAAFLHAVSEYTKMYETTLQKIESSFYLLCHTRQPIKWRLT